MTTTIWSTTHTAPIVFDRISPTLVMITTEMGASQIYKVSDLLEALTNETK